jgi:hypothetical protein
MGEFGFDEFIDHVTTFLQVLGPGVHVVGVCQPCDCDPAQPLHQTRSRATPEPGVKGKTRPHAGCSKQPVPRVCRAEAIARAIAVYEEPSRFVLEFDWRGLRLDEDTWSGSKVNRLIGEFVGQALPPVRFAHRDLT